MNESIARQILDGTAYATLATADAAGRPWASPVWFAQEDYREVVWVSDPRARHSRNVVVRPELALVVFDSTPARAGSHSLCDQSSIQLTINDNSRQSPFSTFARWPG